MSHLVVIIDSSAPEEDQRERFELNLQLFIKQLLVYLQQPFAFLDVFQARGPEVGLAFSNYEIVKSQIMKTTSQLVRDLEDNLVWTEPISPNIGLGLARALCRFAKTGNLQRHIVILANSAPVDSPLLLSSIFQTARLDIKIHAVVHMTSLVSAYVPIAGQTGGSVLTASKENPALRFLNAIFDEPYQRPIVQAEYGRTVQKNQPSKPTRECDVCKNKLGHRFKICAYCFAAMCDTCRCKCMPVQQPADLQ